MKSKTKTTQSATNNSTMTPTNPEWVTQGAQGLAGNIQSLMGQDPKSFVAGASDLQQQGFDAFSNLGGQAQGWMGQAAGLAGAPSGYTPAQMSGAQVGPMAHAQAQTAYGGIQNYMNPYEDQVVANQARDFERQRQMAQMTTDDQAQAAHAFGGSRHGVAASLTNERALEQAGNFSAGLRHQGFGTALGAAQQDADRAQQASMFNAGADNTGALASAQFGQQAGLANMGAQNEASQFGGQQQLNQAQLLAQMGQYGLGGMMDAGGVQQGINQGLAGAPLTVNGALTGSYSQLPLNLFNGQTANSTSNSTGVGTQRGSALDTIGKVAQIGANAAAMFSDERLKVDVRPIGQDEQGRDWYNYRYAWDAPDVTRRGVMAQQILATDPEAVSVHESGFLMVDYSKLGH